RAYGTEARTQSTVADALQRRFRAAFTTARFGNALFSTAEVFAGALTAIIIAAGIAGGTAQGMSSGTLIAFLFLVNLLIEPLQVVVASLDFAQAGPPGLRRRMAVLDGQSELQGRQDPRPLPSGGRSARCEAVSCSCPDGPQVLTAGTVETPVRGRVSVVGD